MTILVPLSINFPIVYRSPLDVGYRLQINWSHGFPLIYCLTLHTAAKLAVRSAVLYFTSRLCTGHYWYCHKSYTYSSAVKKCSLGLAGTWPWTCMIASLVPIFQCVLTVKTLDRKSLRMGRHRCKGGLFRNLIWVRVPLSLFVNILFRYLWDFGLHSWWFLVHHCSLGLKQLLSSFTFLAIFTKLTSCWEVWVFTKMPSFTTSVVGELWILPRSSLFSSMQFTLDESSSFAFIPCPSVAIAASCESTFSQFSAISSSLSKWRLSFLKNFSLMYVLVHLQRISSGFDCPRLLRSHNLLPPVLVWLHCRIVSPGACVSCLK